MIFQRDIRTGQSAAVYIVVKNAQTSTLPAGGPACWDNFYMIGTVHRITQQRGYDVVQHIVNFEFSAPSMGNISAAGMVLLAGVVAPKDLQPGAFGLVQCYGYCPTVRWAKPTETAWWSTFQINMMCAWPVRDLGPCNAFYVTYEALATQITEGAYWPGYVAQLRMRAAGTYDATWDRTVEEALDPAGYAVFWSPTVTTITVAYAPGFVNCM